MEQMGCKNRAAGNKKVFRCSSFSKMLPRCGRAAHICEANNRELYNEMKQKSKKALKESQLPLKSEGCNKSQGFGGNCDSQGKLGMCPSLAEPDSGGFPRSNVSHETMQERLLEKTIFNIRQKGVPPLLLPTSVLQLPRCLVRICNLFHQNSGIENL